MRSWLVLHQLDPGFLRGTHVKFSAWCQRVCLHPRVPTPNQCAHCIGSCEWYRVYGVPPTLDLSWRLCPGVRLRKTAARPRAGNRPQLVHVLPMCCRADPVGCGFDVRDLSGQFLLPRIRKHDRGRSVAYRLCGAMSRGRYFAVRVGVSTRLCLCKRLLRARENFVAPGRAISP